MKKTRQLLQALFWGLLTIAAAIYLLGEFVQMDFVVWPDADKQTRFVVSTLMILLTISFLPLALRLFKFKCIHTQLVQQRERALARWGTLRLLLMGLLLCANTMLYYAFGFETTYGYLAVVVLLCMPFVIPTKSRCEAEVAEHTPHQEESQEQESQQPNDGETTEEKPTDEEANHSHRQL